MRVTDEQLEWLRGIARIERDVALEHLGREGQDPAESLLIVPSVDELVVRQLRDELLEERGQIAEFLLARLAGRGSAEDAGVHRRNANDVEFALLREIAEICPALTTGVWEAAGRLGEGAVSP